MDYIIELTTTRNKICSHSIKIKSLDIYLNSINMGYSALSNVSEIQNLKMLKDFKRGSEIDSFLKHYYQAIDDHSVEFCFKFLRASEIIDVHCRKQNRPQKKLETTNLKILPLTRPKNDVGIEQ